ncbi:MBL fold metallo-hydrolase [Pseudemcibacter aquimaris]|uniref:MBL fold metallo-hydrolase n=1 Tax=Pseudemcibacter aquimaris TaxID=2857064 RepID=UPI00237D83B8|nr:MBL fold metallo-hydrolase [Pseudemcibacter aquimaris]MCC3859587.1 MBL fold metallo-hydrolase [Pseudemcibacter aquimaris]WDU59983.1 MBL fold metallo-hydrolase [Pseudemcibacter aquimaris]
MSVSLSFAQDAQICHIANTGFFVSNGESSVLMDALYADGMDGDPVASGVVNSNMENAKGRFSNVDLIFASHIHEDHMKAKPILRHLRANDNAKAILPAQAAIFMRAAGIGNENERIHYADLKPGEVRALDGYDMPVTLYGLSHGAGNEDITNIGIKIEVNGKTIMHVGDMYGPQAGFGPQNKITVDYLMIPFWYLYRPERVEYIQSIFNVQNIIPMHFALDSSEWMQSMGGLKSVKERTYSSTDNIITLDQEMMCIPIK